MKPKLPAAVYALGAASLLNDAASEMIYPLLPVFLAGTLGAGPAVLGVIEGAADAFSSVLKLVSGQLSDRLGRRKPLVVAGYAIASLVRPLVAFAQSASHVLAIRLTDRLGKGLRSSPRDALIADVTPADQRGRAFGVHEAMDDAGAIIGPLLAYLLLGAGVSMPSVFMLSWIPALLACLVVVLIVREPPRAPRVPAGAEVRAVTSPPARTPVVGRSFVWYLAAVVLFALGNSSDMFLLYRAREAGLSTQTLALLWALHHVVRSALGGWAGGMSDRIGHRRALAIGWAIYAAVYVGFAFATGSTAITALFVVYGLYFGVVGGAAKALVVELVPAEARARGFGLFHLCVGLTSLPASLLFGGLYQKFGAAPAFLVGAALAVLGIAVLPLSRVSRPATAP